MGYYIVYVLVTFVGSSRGGTSGCTKYPETNATEHIVDIVPSIAPPADRASTGEKGAIPIMRSLAPRRRLLRQVPRQWTATGRTRSHPLPRSHCRAPPHHPLRTTRHDLAPGPVQTIHIQAPHPAPMGRQLCNHVMSGPPHRHHRRRQCLSRRPHHRRVYSALWTSPSIKGLTAGETINPFLDTINDVVSNIHFYF